MTDYDGEHSNEDCELVLDMLIINYRGNEAFGVIQSR